jgi:hypothetical protein
MNTYLTISSAVAVYFSIRCMADRKSCYDRAAWIFVVVASLGWVVFLPIGAAVRTVEFFFDRLPQSHGNRARSKTSHKSADEAE